MLARVDVLRRRLVRALFLPDAQERWTEIDNARFYYQALVEDVRSKYILLQLSSSVSATASTIGKSNPAAPIFESLGPASQISTAKIAKFCSEVRAYVDKCTKANIEVLATSTDAGQTQQTAASSTQPLPRGSRVSTPPTSPRGGFESVAALLENLSSSIRSVASGSRNVRSTRARPRLPTRSPDFTSPRGTDSDFHPDHAWKQSDPQHAPTAQAPAVDTGVSQYGRPHPGRAWTEPDPQPAHSAQTAGVNPGFLSGGASQFTRDSENQDRFAEYLQHEQRRLVRHMLTGLFSHYLHCAHLTFVRQAEHLHREFLKSKLNAQRQQLRRLQEHQEQVQAERQAELHEFQAKRQLLMQERLEPAPTMVKVDLDADNDSLSNGSVPDVAVDGRTDATEHVASEPGPFLENNPPPLDQPTQNSNTNTSKQSKRNNKPPAPTPNTARQKAKERVSWCGAFHGTIVEVLNWWPSIVRLKATGVSG